MSLSARPSLYRIRAIYHLGLAMSVCPFVLHSHIYDTIAHPLFALFGVNYRFQLASARFDLILPAIWTTTIFTTSIAHVDKQCHILLT
ncbi:hypothetical protein BDZ89DRAFT_372814 [Hymenopellis radicata]|nr:hypothetical protein BDZ89DRAFT_372814 [Hymenopellis radicata]